MKFSEAMALLEQGKKVRCSSWDHKNWHLHNNSEGNSILIAHSSGANTPFGISGIYNFSTATDWEEYIEPKKKRIVKIWPVIAKIYGTNKFCTLANLFASIEDAKKDGGIFSTGGVDYEIVRLATEYPGIEIELETEE